MLVTLFSVLIVGYLIGCIHGSNFAKLLSGVNLKEVGHGNAGASNAVLSLGWKYGVLVGIIDIGKGIVAIILGQFLLLNYTTFTTEQISILLYSIGAAVILGHNFPVHMNFRGGKGTASLIGIFITLNWQMGLIAVLLLIVISLISNYLIIGVFALYLIFAITAIIQEPTIWPFFITLSLFVIAIILHVENLNRMRLGTEPKITSAFNKKR
ncbi:glycerol-3-phosphate acyltransferase [Lysinibacillus endophyticus]|uniref:Glycerol-3-phosphate acyltransferase n=1 Tax=Ureibacillus endophyticus TaxID=1978490 RepID=A0A494Z8Q4_9BACL|nr:glycerol-3-phosphate acyltransferase [Lysinibacillus endophyticus]RKQ19022.1 glycerol-3-phosphate acyltransferase [Lysinibacillus endophyticus]